MSEPFDVNDLDQLGDVIVTVTLPLPDGREAHVKLRALTPTEISTIKRGVTWPTPPPKDFKKINGEAVPVFDYNDPAYKQADEEADTLYTNRTLVASLIMNIPGETVDEKCEAIKTRLGQFAHSLLVSAMNKINMPSKEDVDSVLRSFRRDGFVGTSDDDPVFTHSEKLARLVENRTIGDDGLPTIHKRKARPAD